jgi:hypothetical protein
MALTATESEGVVNTKKLSEVHATVALYSKHTGEETFSNV